MTIDSERCMKLFRLMDRTRRAWADFTPKPEVSKSQFGTLLALRHGGKCPSERKGERDPFEPMTLSVLAGIMEQSMPAVSQRISKLEAAGYVSRTPDEKDKRTIWIQLTPSGVELLQSSYQDMVREIGSILEKMGQEDSETLIRVLEKLAGVIEESVKEKHQ